MIYVKFTYSNDGRFWNLPNWLGVSKLDKRKPMKFRSEDDMLKFIEKYNEKYVFDHEREMVQRGTIWDFEIINDGSPK